jgi:hypothetical protein
MSFATGPASTFPLLPSTRTHVRIVHSAAERVELNDDYHDDRIVIAANELRRSSAPFSVRSDRLLPLCSGAVWLIDGSQPSA